MKIGNPINITEVYDYKTVCPTQFSFKVVGNSVFKSGFIRYRHGFLRLEMYDTEDMLGDPERMFGARISKEDEGEISIECAIEEIKSYVNITLKWDGTYHKEEVCGKLNKGDRVRIPKDLKERMGEHWVELMEGLEGAVGVVSSLDAWPPSIYVDLHSETYGNVSFWFFEGDLELVKSV